MKLYYSPGACSLSPHIALYESGLAFELVKVDLKSKVTTGGENFLKINPKGYVPALVLDNGEHLSEGAVIIQYIADLVPEKSLSPAAGTMARYHLQEWIIFISTEVHKVLGTFFRPHLTEETKRYATELISKRFAFIEEQLSNTTFLTGEHFTIADGYLFTTLRWTFGIKLDLHPWPHLLTFFETVSKRPSVQQALHAEGIASSGYY